MPIDFRPVASCVEVTIKGQDTTYQSLMYNVIHVQTSATVPTPAEVDTAMNVVSTWVGAAYRQNFSLNIAVVEIRAKSLAAEVAPFNFVSVNWLGTQGGYDEIEHAPLLLLHGALSSRNQAGRFYAFPPGYGGVSPLGYDATHMNNLVNALLNLRLALASAGLQLAIASKDTGQCYRATSFGRTNRVTIQKRRRVSFGR